MKKLLIALMTVLCLCTLGVAANDENTGTDSTDVLYGVTEGYTWSIHAAVDFGNDANLDGSGANGHLLIEDQTVSVTKNVIQPGKKLQITIGAYSCDSEGTAVTNNVFQIANGSTAQLAYTVTGQDGEFKEGAIAIGDSILEVLAGVNAGSETMDFELDNTQFAGSNQALLAEVAGQYYGKVSYTAAVVNA
jgi:hypothetical protein